MEKTISEEENKKLESDRLSVKSGVEKLLNEYNCSIVLMPKLEPDGIKITIDVSNNPPKPINEKKDEKESVSKNTDKDNTPPSTEI